MLKLRTGDIITSTASPPTSGFFYHKGIVVVNNGVPLIYHNTPVRVNPFGGNIIAETLEEYLKPGRQMISVENCGMTAEEILKAHDRLKHKKFNGTLYNCEHYVSDVVDGDAKSKQIIQWGVCIGVGIGISVFCYFAFSKRG